MIRAAVLRSARRIDVVACALPAPAPDEVQIEVAACGVCATDLSVWRRGREVGPGLTGHEIVGEVVQVGSAVEGLEVGLRVCVEPNLATGCGSCTACAAGSAFFCTQKRPLPVWGFADAMNVRGAGALCLPGDMTAGLGILAEPLGCAVHALRRSWSVAAGGGLAGVDVVIVGAGPLGLTTILACRHFGAERVRVAARGERQRAAVRQLGGDVIGEDSRPSADLVVVTAGEGEEMLSRAMAMAAPGGEVVVLALVDSPQVLDARRAVVTEKRVAFSISYGGSGLSGDMATAIRILDRNQDAADVVTGPRFGLEDVAAAFAAAGDRVQRHPKVVVQPAMR